jgi:hypothetical protein
VGLRRSGFDIEKKRGRVGNYVRWVRCTILLLARGREKNVPKTDLLGSGGQLMDLPVSNLT